MIPTIRQSKEIAISFLEVAEAMAESARSRLMEPAPKEEAILAEINGAIEQLQAARGHVNCMMGKCHL